jgi:hypothetical protein
MAELFEVSAGDGKLMVTGMLTLTDGGAVLQLYGGTFEHVGSVTVSLPRDSLADKDRTSVTSSVINLLSHKEEMVGRPAAEMLAVALDRPVVCAAGIHVDGATDDELRLLTKNSEDVVRLLMQRVQK